MEDEDWELAKHEKELRENMGIGERSFRGNQLLIVALSKVLLPILPN